MSQPVAVSPIIKFARWSMLTLGIAYGAFNQKRLSKTAKKLRETEARKKKVRDAKLAEEKHRLSEAEKRAFDILSGKLD